LAFQLRGVFCRVSLQTLVIWRSNQAELNMEINKIYNENCIETMERMPDNFIDCVVTSPPYWGLRDYGPYSFIWGADPNCKHIWGDKINGKSQSGSLAGSTLQGTPPGEERRPEWESVFCVDCGAWRGCFGLEPTPELYVQHSVQIFREIRRVLKPEGTLWLNLGDTYAAYWGDKYGNTQSFGQTRENIGNAPPCKKSPDFKTSIFKPKDLVGIPWMVAFALRSDGWWLRQDIIWSKPNPMPESVTDRCTKAHEYIFLLTKSEKYFYDQAAIKEPLKKSSHVRLGQNIAAQSGSERVPGKTNGNMKAVCFGGAKGRNYNPEKGDPNFRNGSEQWGREYVPTPDLKANRKSIWTITTKPFSEAHFATFPIELPSLCILAGSPKDGIVYDPFMGAATTALAALKYGRRFIGSEINPEYCEIGNKRIAPYLSQLNLAI